MRLYEEEIADTKERDSLKSDNQYVRVAVRPRAFTCWYREIIHRLGLTFSPSWLPAIL